MNPIQRPKQPAGHVSRRQRITKGSVQLPALSRIQAHRSVSHGRLLAASYSQTRRPRRPKHAPPAWAPAPLLAAAPGAEGKEAAWAQQTAVKRSARCPPHRRGRSLGRRLCVDARRLPLAEAEPPRAAALSEVPSGPAAPVTIRWAPAVGALSAARRAWRTGPGREGPPRPATRLRGHGSAGALERAALLRRRRRACMRLHQPARSPRSRSGQEGAPDPSFPPPGQPQSQRGRRWERPPSRSPASVQQETDRLTFQQRTRVCQSLRSEGAGWGPKPSPAQAAPATDRLALFMDTRGAAGPALPGHAHTVGGGSPCHNHNTRRPRSD